MERGFKYRIYPNESQRDQIARTLGSCRFVYNRALDVKKSAYAKTGKTVSWAELSRMLPAWKRDPETSWPAQVDSMALQQSIRDLDRAYKNFFRRVREGGKPGFPKFKSRRHARQSYRTNGGKVLDRNHIALPKLGPLATSEVFKFVPADPEKGLWQPVPMGISTPIQLWSAAPASLIIDDALARLALARP